MENLVDNQNIQKWFLIKVSVSYYDLENYNSELLWLKNY